MHEPNSPNIITADTHFRTVAASRPKILIALFRLPYPATDGTRYKILYNLVSGLKLSYEVEFFVVHIKDYQASDIEYIEREFGKVHLFYHSKFAFVCNGLRALTNGLPIQAQAFHFVDAQKWLDAHIDEYDAVYVHEIRMTEFFIRYDEARKQKLLVDFNDAISLNYAAGIKKMGLLKKIFYSWEGQRVARYESKVLENFQHFSIVSEKDKQHLLNASHYTGSKDRDFSVINHGVPMVADLAPMDTDKIFFIGSLDYEPNRDALQFLFDTLWVDILEVLPQLELIVVGGGFVAESWKKQKQVTFTGFVPKVFEVVRSCKALLAPIRFAGGTPSKIIEAMSYGIPVITTNEGCAGIRGIIPNQNICVVSSSASSEWVTTIRQLVTDSNRRNSIGHAGRKLVEQYYSRDAAEQSFRDRFQFILKNNLL